MSRRLATLGNVRSFANKALTVETMNPNMRSCKYEVRGEIYLASLKRMSEGKDVIALNIGNPQSLGQQPMTYSRQVMALLLAPFLLKDPNVTKMFPADVIERAQLYLKNTKGGLGAYSDSKGVPYIRQLVANFIQSKTGQVSNPDNIFLSNGASECAKLVLNALIRGKTDGIMVPIPQYPLYSASIALFGGELVPYYLNEEGGWALNIAGLQKSIDESRAKGILAGEASYTLFEQEKSERLDSLKRRAHMLSAAFNRLPGVSCQETEGAMYAFPRISLPAKAIAEAERLGKQPDVLYCLELLNETGLCCVPGSGFQQEPGTFHFRTTILPAEERFPEIIEKFSTFHRKFMA
eukprot:gene5271-3764_t